MIEIKITGLEELQQKLDEAANALQGLEGELADLEFNPYDPSSVEAAVTQLEQAIDAKIAPYRGNEMVESIAADMRERSRQKIYDRAAKARAKSPT